MVSGDNVERGMLARLEYSSGRVLSVCEAAAPAVEIGVGLQEDGEIEGEGAVHLPARRLVLVVALGLPAGCHDSELRSRCVTLRHGYVELVRRIERVVRAAYIPHKIGIQIGHLILLDASAVACVDHHEQFTFRTDATFDGVEQRTEFIVDEMELSGVSAIEPAGVATGVIGYDRLVISVILPFVAVVVAHRLAVTRKEEEDLVAGPTPLREAGQRTDDGGLRRLTVGEGDNIAETTLLEEGFEKSHIVVAVQRTPPRLRLVITADPDQQCTVYRHSGNIRH